MGVSTAVQAVSSPEKKNYKNLLNLGLKSSHYLGCMHNILLLQRIEPNLFDSVWFYSWEILGASGPAMNS
jgi:hypothetical protein